jgi:hypothetical protein
LAKRTAATLAWYGKPEEAAQRTTAGHQSSLSENQGACHSLERPVSEHAATGDGFLATHGSGPTQAHQRAIDWIGQHPQLQASYLAYMDVFWVLMLISLAAIPLALALRKIKLGGTARAGH